MTTEAARFTRENAIEVLHGVGAIAMGLMHMQATGEAPSADDREWWFSPDFTPFTGHPAGDPLNHVRAIAALLDAPGTMTAEALYTSHVHWQLKGPSWQEASPATRRVFAIIVATWPGLVASVAEAEAQAAAPPAPPKERANLKKGGQRTRRAAKTGGKAADKVPVPVKLGTFDRPASEAPPRKGGRFQKRGG